MATHRRVNVASGRQLEQVAHYARAARVDDTVLLAGTTAIDRAGNVRGAGDVAAQVDAIMAIAEWSLGKAGSGFHDVVRSRMYVTDVALADAAGRAVAKYFHDVKPAATLVGVDALSRPEQLIEIELDAVDGARGTRHRVSSGRALEDRWAYSRAVRVGDRVFVSGSSALNAQGAIEAPGDVYRQTRATLDTIFRAVAEAGGARGDIGYTKTDPTHRNAPEPYTRAWLEAFGDVRPTSTLLGVPALVRPEMLVEIEAEAIVGAARTRRDIYTEREREKPRGYARAVQVGDWIWVSGCTSISAAGEIQAPGDWGAQADLAHETIRWALAQLGASMDDVVRRCTFNVRGATRRPYGEGPAWFAKSCPASLGCTIAALARPEIVVEVEVAAVKGAGAKIEWIAPDAVDPLDRPRS